MLRLPRADAVEREIFGTPERHAAPDLLNAEVVQALRRLERGNAVDAVRVAGAVVSLGQLRIVRYPTAPLVDRAWALRHNFSAYDAMYVALAEAVGKALVTTDGRLARAVRAHTSVEVRLVA